MRYIPSTFIYHLSKRVLALLLSTAMLAACVPVQAPVPAPAPVAAPVLPAYTNPVFNQDFPDPFILPVEGGYYAYSTNAAGRNVQVIYSPDLFTWERAGEEGDALPVLPAWAQANASLTWAPSALRRGGGDNLYYFSPLKKAGRHGRTLLRNPLARRPLLGSTPSPPHLPLGAGGRAAPGTAW